MEKVGGLTQFFEEISDVKQNGTYNIYMIRYYLRSQEKNFAIALINASKLAELIFENMSSHCGKRCKKYNPLCVENDSYEWLPLTEIEKHWDKIVEIFESTKNMAKGAKKLSSSNLCLMDLTYNNKRYYIGLSQYPIDNVYKGKPLWHSKEGKIVKCEQDDYFLFANDITFIVTSEEGKMIIYIFNQKVFNNFFNYDEHISQYARDHFCEVEEIKLVDSWEIIKRKIHKKYVYNTIYKIVKDSEYLKQMKDVSRLSFKERVLKKDTSGSFTQADFTEDGKIILTQEKMKPLLDILGKKHRYNYFTDKAEE